jgi:hypothetical protein
MVRSSGPESAADGGSALIAWQGMETAQNAPSKM